MALPKFPISNFEIRGEFNSLPIPSSPAIRTQQFTNSENLDRRSVSLYSQFEPPSKPTSQLATMAVPSNSRDDLSDQQNGKTSNSEKKKEKSRKQSEIGCSSPAKKSAKCSSFEDQIYSSWNGKTCHQCRHRTMDFVAACKNLKKDKPCTIKFCHKCLWNRYGEKTEDVAFLEDWNCPKCRGICNCSFCRKKQGHQPTGILIHTARTTGFSSVSEMLHAKGPENFGIKKVVKGIDVGPTHTPPLPSNLDERKRKKMKQDGLKDIKVGNSIDGLC